MTRYLAALTNRDKLRLGGRVVPVWELLDVQPDGWLISLAYAGGQRPDAPVLWDCGAWSYRREDVPALRGRPVTAEWAAARYAELARPGDRVVAPDHMLTGGNLDSRRRFNRESAARFLGVCPPGLTPVAVCHGADAGEYVASATALRAMGYRDLAVGGVAGPSRGRGATAELIRRVREAVPGCWLHVLGLSAPSWFSRWVDLGIDSCDGSSHYKQAFRAGKFFNYSGGQLAEHAAARPGQPVTAPECGCKACATLRGHGIDTRTYGSNEHNMGRAVHNLTQLLRAHRLIARGTAALVACSAKKAGGPHPAKDLYVGTWHRKARAYVEALGHPWFILSARHGLLHPEQVVEPYDQTLADATAEESRAWATRAMGQLAAAGMPGRVVLLAGRNYAEPLAGPLAAAGVEVARPLEGLGIGEQVAELMRLREAIRPTQRTLF